MKSLPNFLLCFLFFLTGLFISNTWHILNSNSSAVTSSKSIASAYEIIAFDDFKKTPITINGKSISVQGRVYQDAGGYFWLVSSIGDKPKDSYALKLTAWPFSQSPPVDAWSSELIVSGVFSSRDSSSDIDFLLGPKIIEIKAQ